MGDASHPALKGMNETMETVKETGKGAVKGAVKWGVILGVVGMAASVALAVPTLGVSLLAGATPLAFGLGAAKFGAIVGGAVGGASALAGAGEKIEEKKSRMIENYERAQMTSERSAMVQMQRERLMASSRGQSQTLGVSPNSLPNRGMDTGMARA